MAKHELLDNITHKDLRINLQYQPGAGFDHQMARVFPIELGALQAEYPLFFARNTDRDQYDLVALLGFQSDENLYLGQGDWLAKSLPLSIERQPFLIGFEGQATSPSSDQPVIHVDMDHPSISEEHGERVFLPHGGESMLLERMNEVLGLIHEGHGQSDVFSRTLAGLDLIEPLNLEVTFVDGEKRTLSGLFAINEDNLRQLNAESLDLLHQRGYLQHIYMLLASLPQLGALIERKNQKLQSQSE